MALSVLVVIEMLNAMNALSEDGSLLTMPPWCNKWLLVAIVVSLGLHMVIMYIPALASLLEITALDFKVRCCSWPLLLLAPLPLQLLCLLVLVSLRWHTCPLPFSVVVPPCPCLLLP